MPRRVDRRGRSRLNTGVLRHLIDNAVGPREAGQPLRYRRWPAPLRMSGSGALSEADLAFLARASPAYQTVIIDLRQESHALLNGQPVSWWLPGNAANAGLPVDAVTLDEAMRIADLQAQCGSETTLFRRNKSSTGEVTLVAGRVPVDSVCDEATATRAHGMTYMRLPMQDRTGAPDAVSIRNLMALLSSRGPRTWWHFHCQAGKGRTSVFCALVDTIVRGAQRSLSDIAREHHRNGAIDLLRTSAVEPKRSKYAERIAFLRAFHAEVRGATAGG